MVHCLTNCSVPDKVLRNHLALPHTTLIVQLSARLLRCVPTIMPIFLTTINNKFREQLLAIDRACFVCLRTMTHLRHLALVLRKSLATIIVAGRCRGDGSTSRRHPHLHTLLVIRWYGGTANTTGDLRTQSPPRAVQLTHFTITTTTA
jgi:hypothetical protein